MASGIPENEREPYRAAHLALGDATVDEDEERIADADEAMARWLKYG